MVSRFATSGRASGSKVITRSESVLAFLMRLAVSSAVIRSITVLPSDLLILAPPSRPRMVGASESSASGSRNTVSPPA